jgi:hypothetical protein
MVSQTAKWVLVNTNIDPLQVADVWGIPESECWDYITDHARALREADESYDPLQVQKEVAEWVETIPNKNNIRIDAIKEQLIDAKQNPDKHDVPKLLFEVSVLSGRADKTTPEMIARAKEYPIATMLNVQRRGNVSCPFHKDLKPSFQIKPNNTFTCYSCGEYGDAIDLYKKLNNCSFNEAVQYLNNHV